MQIDFKNDLELEGEGNELIEAGIDKEDLPFIIDLITRQQYRNPIGSIVREITSNCFDAHAEAEVDDAVMIKFDVDEMGSYIKFIDMGIGMSPERIKDVYLRYGKSTKRDTNKQIGGFGLGGKSPLSYTTQFYLTTVYDKIQYEYIIHKGRTLPTIELLFTEPVERRNGSEVKIYFTNIVDEITFENECRKQLVYFDNVYFLDKWRFNNNYKIYEGEHFKVRSDVNDNPYSNQLHLCIGKVAYPIDFNVLNRKPINIPVALKFEIGDLIVTPERESIRYVEVNGRETKDIINEKIELVLHELKERYYKQDSLKCNSLIEYFKLRKEDPELKINEVTLVLDEIIEVNAVECTKLKGCLLNIQSDVMGVWRFKYNLYKLHRKNRKDRNHWINEMVLKDKLFISKQSKHSIPKTQYVCNKFNKREISVGRLIFDGYRELSKKVGVRWRNTLGYELPYDTNIIKQLKILKDAVESEIAEHSIDFDAIEVPKEWLARRGFVVDKVKRKEDEIVVYDMTEPAVSKRKMFINLEDYRRFTGFIIYGFNENAELLNNFVKLFDKSRYNTHHQLKKSKAVKIIMIATGNNKYFRTIKHAVHVENFIGDNKVFKHFATALVIRRRSKFEDIQFNVKGSSFFNEIFEYVSVDQYKNYRDIGLFADEFSVKGLSYLENEFIDSIIDTALQYNLVDKEIYEKHLSLNNFLDRLELLQYIIVFTPKMLPYIIDFFVLKGKPVNEVWTNPESYELELINDSMDKINYILEIDKESDIRSDEGDFINELKAIKQINNVLLNYYNYAKRSQN